MPINSKYVLVVGGAGYIGSHMVLALQKAGYEPIVLDNLSTGHQHAVLSAKLIIGDIADKKLLNELFTTYSFSAVMHFAAFIDVNESMQNPAKYYQNNVAKTLVLLDVMREHQVKQFIFSSTAAVYGNPQYTPIDEAHPLAPINPYGRSKLMVETILQDYGRSDGLQYAILRYFNAAGCDPEGHLREEHEPETHLIPLVLQVAMGQREFIQINGQDYPTIDGTCVRDYVHVTDLCTAHLQALEKLQSGTSSCIYNLGTGQGYSIQQVINAARIVTRCDIPVINGSRRAGDPAILVADATRAMRELNWQPKYSQLNTIIEHVWQTLNQSIYA